MKRHLKTAATLILILSPSYSFAGFPFQAGKYEGLSVCKDQAGQTFSTKVALLVSEKTLETVYSSPDGEIHVVKNADFDTGGFFTLSGPDVIRGNGYCLPNLFCHYDATLRVQGEEVPGEDSLFLKDSILYRNGSTSFKGTRIICEESFSTFSKKP